MKEPKKIPLSDKIKTEPKKIPMPPTQPLHDDFGYLFTIEDQINKELDRAAYEDSENRD
jgi:hypothetical protein